MLLVALLVISGVALAASIGGVSSIPQGPLSVVAAPVQAVLDGFGRLIASNFRGPGDALELRSRNQQLERELEAARVESQQLRELAINAQRYRDLLGFAAQNPALALVGADVTGPVNIGCNGPESQRPDWLRTGKPPACARTISSDSNPYLRFININAGRRQGLREGMPVLGNGSALVGRVARVDEASSTVQLLSDARSSVNVMIQGTRVAGTVTGLSTGELVLRNVQQTDSIGVGDPVVTSGLGNLLPPGLVIGQIERVTSSDAGLFKEAWLRPAVDYTRIEAVMVITNSFSPPLLPVQGTPIVATAAPALVGTPAPGLWERVFGK